MWMHCLLCFLFSHEKTQVRDIKSFVLSLFWSNLVTYATNYIDLFITSLPC
jgi:hypothetical protein